MIESAAYELIKQEGIEDGLKKGLLKARREDILALLNTRFSPSASTLAEIHARLEPIEDLQRLQDLLIAAAQVEDLAAFQERLLG